jgi:FkbM family methyltransferase
VKRLIQKALNRFGYRIERIRSTSPGPHLFILDYVLHLLNERRGGEVTFVQIGANDGRQEDPCYAWIEAFPWRGVLVEPQPALAAALRELHSRNPRIAVQEALISSESGTATLYFLNGGPSWATGIASLSKEAISTHRHKIEGFDSLLSETMLQTMTLSQLLERHSLSAIDYLQIDTEGHDFEIIKTVDFGRIRPSVICYEHANLSYEDNVACRSLLAREGYHFASWLGDTVACHEDLLLVSDDRQCHSKALR